jgi:ketosteroid isomerase-like protein
VKAFQEGTVAWLADRPTLTTAEGMRVSARITAVFRREGDDWKIVQSHFSMGRRLTAY